MNNGPHILVLGTADWSQPIATNQHYVVRELCSLPNARIAFIESLALRRPQLTKNDIRRVGRRLLAAARFRRASAAPSARHRPENLEVVSLVTLPFHKGLAKPINSLVVTKATREWGNATQSRLLWTYSPVTNGLERKATSIVYHCVDLLAEVPGIDPGIIQSHERYLAKKGAIAVASSEVVKRHLEQMGFETVILWQNVADVSAFESVAPLSTARVPGRVVFAGNITPTKVDFALLHRLCDAGLEVRLAGPIAEGDEGVIERLNGAGAQYLGMLSLADLAVELASATVGLIPYTLNDYTKGVSPLKTFEYAAAGLPVVSTCLPGVIAKNDLIWVEPAGELYVNRVRELAESFSLRRARSLIAEAHNHSWSTRGLEVRQLAHELTNDDSGERFGR